MAMSKKHRSALIIFKEILEAVNSCNEATISKIAVMANVPYSRLKKQIEKMVKAGLLAESDDSGRRTYSLTPKGRRVLSMLRDMESFLSSLGLI